MIQLVPINICFSILIHRFTGTFFCIAFCSIVLHCTCICTIVVPIRVFHKQFQKISARKKKLSLAVIPLSAKRNLQNKNTPIHLKSRSCRFFCSLPNCCISIQTNTKQTSINQSRPNCSERKTNLEPPDIFYPSLDLQNANEKPATTKM